MRPEVTIGIAGLLVTLLATAVPFSYQIYKDREKSISIVEKEVQKASSFSCSLQANPRGGDVWTVMYERGTNRRPWLRMVRTMGEGWDTKARCDEIANRLDTYREDGLQGFDYRDAPNLPGQYILCAKTKVSPNACPEVITLAPEDDPYDALYEVASALLPGRTPSYQCNDEAICPAFESTSINLKNYLSE